MDIIYDAWREKVEHFLESRRAKDAVLLAFDSHASLDLLVEGNLDAFYAAVVLERSHGVGVHVLHCHAVGSENRHHRDVKGGCASDLFAFRLSFEDLGVIAPLGE